MPRNPKNDADDLIVLRKYMLEIAKVVNLGVLKDTNDIFLGGSSMQAVKLLANDVKELMARARGYEDKPHLIFSWIMAMADRHIPDVKDRDEIKRVMDKVYHAPLGRR